MKLRMVDYVANPGGGVRFTLEMLKAFTRLHPEAPFEVVSHGAALERYRALLSEDGIGVRGVDLRPANHWHTRSFRLLEVPGGRALQRRVGLGTQWHYGVPEAAFADADVVWMPWVHRHRVPAALAYAVVGSFHDATFFQFEGLVGARELADERETVRSWLASEARIVLSSKNTASVLGELFGAPPSRFTVVPLSGAHTEAAPAVSLPSEWEWSRRPYLIYPANTVPHKNHEVLLEGVARWGARHPLVLTGQGTDLARPGRGAELRAFAEARGLRTGCSLIPLGYLPNDLYYGLLDRAWCLVMPSLAEGGGGFPVMEAMLRGVPVVCSDIPVMREQLSWIGGEVLWFDPRDPGELAARLRELEAAYPSFKAQAARQVAALQRRSWDDVAGDYWRLITRQARQEWPRPPHAAVGGDASDAEQI